MKKITIIILFAFSLIFISCEDNILKSSNFTVKTEKVEYAQGEQITFEFENAPDWVTFYSGEETHIYPESSGTGIKGMANKLLNYTYTYKQKGDYEVVFVGGNTNYKGNNQSVVKLHIKIN